MGRNRVAPRMLRSQSGSFLLSALVVASLLSMTVLITWRAVAQQQTELEKLKLTTSRDLVVTSALRMSRVATFFYHSISQNAVENEMLIKCLIDDDLGNDCVTSPGNYPMKLVRHDAATSTYAPITGTATNPAYYNYYGQPCFALSEECPFEISATFQPTCAAAAPSCAAAATINVSINVGINSAYRGELLQLAQTAATQTISITDFHGSYYPVLPPTTPIGTPISTGAGRGGFISVYVGGGGSPPVPSGGGGGGVVIVPATISVCGAGQVKSGSCGSFQF